jgi:hypothetical protein
MAVFFKKIIAKTKDMREDARIINQHAVFFIWPLGQQA